MIIHVQSKCNTIHKYAQETSLIKCIYIYMQCTVIRATNQMGDGHDKSSGKKILLRDRESGAGPEVPNVRERDGSGSPTGGSGTGAGELLAGAGGSGMEYLVPCNTLV